MQARGLVSLAIAVAGVTVSHAALYSWVSWNAPSGGTVTGTIATSVGNVGVTVTGPFFQVLTSYPSWTPATSWKDGSIVDNAPNNTSIVGINSVGTYSVTFDRPVVDLAFSVWSVGRGGLPVTYSFDKSLSFVAGGPSAEYGGGSITTGASSLTGTEGNGTVLFAGPLTSLGFTTSPAEHWHGFNLGLKNAQPVPEPMTLILGAGALAAGIRRRRRRA